MNNSAGVVPASASFSDGSELWDVASTSQAAVSQGIAAGEAFRLHDITARGAFEEMAPIFAIPCLWSNVGHLGTQGVQAVEVHLMGAGSNPVISGHCIEAADSLSLTVTYAPACHALSTAQHIGDRFLHHVSVLASGGDCPYS